MSVSIEISGNTEVAAYFRAMAAGLGGQILETAVMAGAQPVVNAAKINAPYKDGTLRRSIHAGDPEWSGNTVSISVGTDLIYARIQEYGGHIYPKVARFLVFEIDGKLIFAKHVYLPPRPYLRPALDENRTTVRDEIERAVMAQLRAA